MPCTVASWRFSGLRGTQWCYKSVFPSGDDVVWSAMCRAVLLGAGKERESCILYDFWFIVLQGNKCLGHSTKHLALLAERHD